MALPETVQLSDATQTTGCDRAADIATWTASAIGRSMMSSARFSLGRILLHLVAMLGDRCVRFHVSGIVRELPWIAASLTLLARARVRLIGALALPLTRPTKHLRSESSADPKLLTASVTSRSCACAMALLLTLIPSARADEMPRYGVEAAVQEITQLFWLAETASACGWAQGAEAANFKDFAVRFLAAHLAKAHKQALVSLVTEEHYKAELRRSAWEGAAKNCASSLWRFGWLSFKAAADKHESEY